MLGVGEKFPAFSLQATVSTEAGKAFQEDYRQDYPGKWKVYFFWPKDFTFVCPTEIAAFGKLNRRVPGPRHAGSRRQHGFRVRAPGLAERPPDLRACPSPCWPISSASFARALGILDPKEGVAQRATFIVDPENAIRFVSVNDLFGGRNPQEVLRVLDALQTDELCPCNWHKGEAVLQPAV